MTQGRLGRCYLGIKLLQIRIKIYSFPNFYFLPFLIITENPNSSCYNYVTILFEA